MISKFIIFILSIYLRSLKNSKAREDFINDMKLNKDSVGEAEYSQKIDGKWYTIDVFTGEKEEFKND